MIAFLVEQVVVVVVSVPDYFWSRVSPFFQLSWNSHTPLFKRGRFHSNFVGLACMLRVCLHGKGAMKWEKRGVGNISFRRWRKPEYPERTTGQPQVTDKLLSLSYDGPKPFRIK